MFPAHCLLQMFYFCENLNLSIFYFFSCLLSKFGGKFEFKFRKLEIFVLMVALNIKRQRYYLSRNKTKVGGVKKLFFKYCLNIKNVSPVIGAQYQGDAIVILFLLRVLLVKQEGAYRFPAICLFCLTLSFGLLLISLLVSFL